ncbi:MAG: 2-O-methyltransferase NoeI [candidate division BRC1 bacterium ADurb.BinA364]|nr:MAG: 2-O-methyltransferase NoeI [candidate division BRC1 bacterium ADurb.BinA364]
MKALAAFENGFAGLAPFLPKIGEDKAREIARARAAALRPDQAPQAILQAIRAGGLLDLAGGRLEYFDDDSLWICLKELLLNEDYYFESAAEAPRVLDCGAYFGLAVHYFKRLHPRCRVTAFEPNPRVLEVLRANVARNGYADVEILPYAIAGRDGKAAFRISERFSMAGSLTERRINAGDEVRTVEVECRRLSRYLAEPVDFLKLDIEGSEDEALAEAAPLLGNVRFLFCEYHHASGMPTDRLSRILRVLDKANFDYHVGKSATYAESTARRPMAAVEKPYSAVIWAANKNWTVGKRAAARYLERGKAGAAGIRRTRG